MPAVLPTFYLPNGPDWPVAERAFGAASLPTVRPDPARLGALAAALAASADRLRAIPAAEIVAALDRTARRWADPAFAPRAALVGLLPAVTGYAPAMVSEIVGRMLEDWRAGPLEQRLRAELADPGVLDGWRPHAGGRTRAFGPRLTLHICAGNLPGVSIQSLVDALLVKSPSLVKPAAGEPLWAAAWARILAEELPALADSLAVAWWPGGDAALEGAVLAHAEAVIANAGDAAISDLRRRLPPHVRLLDYGARISFAVVARQAEAASLGRLAADLAYDFTLFDQQGCVSPQILFLEDGGVAAADLAAALDGALAALAERLPRGPLAPEQAVAARQVRDQAEWRALAGEPVAVVGPPDGRWTVVIDPAAPFAPVGASRTVIIRPVAAAAAIPGLIAPFRAYLQSVALAGADAERGAAIAELLAGAGVARIVAPGALPWPAAAWHHDGRQPLAALLRWVDWE